MENKSQSMVPAFAVGDTVKFEFGDLVLTGEIWVVDRGVFEDPDHVYYDIISENCLYKHIPEGCTASV